MENKSLFPLVLFLANERRDRELRDAARARLVQNQPRRSVRLVVGQSLVRVGERLVGEPNLELARSR
jgi:hypothetical protein